MNGSISTGQRQKVQRILEEQSRQQIEALLVQVEATTDDHEIETLVQAWSREVGRQTLQALAPAVTPPYAEPSVECCCGGTGVYQRQRAAQVLTSFGLVNYRRAYYVCGTCHQGWCPLEQQWGGVQVA